MNPVDISVPCFEFRLEVACLPYCFQGRDFSMWLAVVDFDEPFVVFIEFTAG